MPAFQRLMVTVDRIHHHATHLPLGIWLPFLVCMVLIGLASYGSLLGAMQGGLHSLSGTDAQSGDLLGTHMVLGEKDPRLSGARITMLRHEYGQCEAAQSGLRRALAARDASATAWQRRFATTRSSYDLIAQQSADQVFARTGLPRRFCGN